MIDLVGFAIAVLIVELTPGPNMAWLATLTISEGRRAGLGAVAGVTLGLAANAALSVLAASVILETDGPLGRAVSLLAAAMMTWLAWDAWKGSADTAQFERAGRSGRHALAGFALNLLNPKAALFLVAVMPQFVPGGQPTIPQGFVFAATSVTIATVIHLALVFGAERARGALLAEARARMVRRVLAVAMLGVAAWFLTKAFS
ncbi:LysE family translocator [Erythrobacter colymbi]|uniref:LysE family translocator n=1 Tax=Erythrobacter colymbi TaxID=1161202 RepID=UPI001F0B70E6|nr:LysE family translocator [Erythrobacter colymbi]